MPNIYILFTLGLIDLLNMTLERVCLEGWLMRADLEWRENPACYT